MCLSHKEKSIKHGCLMDFDKNAVNILNSIIQITDLEIVISSDWKKWCKFEDMCIFYKSQGIIKIPFDYTPNINGLKNRVNEIKQYLDKNIVDKWCVVDDLHLELDNFVRVSKTDEGITEIGIKEKILKFYI
jgi:hypothetical protein